MLVLKFVLWKINKYNKFLKLFIFKYYMFVSKFIYTTTSEQVYFLLFHPAFYHPLSLSLCSSVSSAFAINAAPTHSSSTLPFLINTQTLLLFFSLSLLPLPLTPSSLFHNLNFLSAFSHKGDEFSTSYHFPAI